MISKLVSILEKNNSEKEIEHAIQQEIEDGMFSFNEVVNFIDSGNDDEICWGIQILSQFDTDNLTPLLKKYLINPNLEIQYCAVMAFRIRPHPDVIPNLLTLLSSSDALLCRLVGDALVAIGIDAASSLEQLVQQPVNNGVIEATRALALIQNKDSIATLFSLLDSPSTQVQHWAERGLDNLGVGMTFFDPN